MPAATIFLVSLALLEARHCCLNHSGPGAGVVDCGTKEHLAVALTDQHAASGECHGCRFYSQRTFNLEKALKICFTFYLKHVKYSFFSPIFQPISETKL